MSTVFQRLELKGRKIESFTSATEADIEELCINLKSVDDSITADIKLVKTTEEHCPSHPKKPVKQKSLPLSTSVQHARNTDIMIQCEQCEM